MDTGRACNLLLTSPLAASQNFEYKMSNILDKPLEVRSPLAVDGAFRRGSVRGQLTFHSLLPRVSLVISRSFPEPSVHTGTKPY